MVAILVRPAELKQMTSQMRDRGKKIGRALYSIDVRYPLLEGDGILGNRANAVQSHYQSKRDVLQQTKELALHFA